MSRFVVSTCGVFAEALSFDATAHPLAIGVWIIGVASAAIAWSADLRRLVDRIVGVDLSRG